MKELIKNLEELNRKAEKGGGDARQCFFPAFFYLYIHNTMSK